MAFDQPVFLIWPERTEHNGFWLLDVGTGYHHDLCQCPSIQNLGLEHFYAAFGLGCSRNLPTSSAARIACSVSMDIATQLQPLQHGIPCEAQAKKRAKTAAHDVDIQPDVAEEVDSSPNGSDSEASSSFQYDVGKTESWTSSPGRHGLLNSSSSPARYPGPSPTCGIPPFACG